MSKLLDDIMQRAEELDSKELKEIAEFCSCLANGESNCKNCGSEDVVVYETEIEKWIECNKCGSILQEE